MVKVQDINTCWQHFSVHINTMQMTLPLRCAACPALAAPFINAADQHSQVVQTITSSPAKQAVKEGYVRRALWAMHLLILLLLLAFFNPNLLSAARSTSCKTTTVVGASKGVRQEENYAALYVCRLM
jgi:hypothetical protein